MSNKSTSNYPFNKLPSNVLLTFLSRNEGILPVSAQTFCVPGTGPGSRTELNPYFHVAWQYSGGEDK